MLSCSDSGRRAVHVPVLLTVVSLPVLFGGVFAVRQAPGFGNALLVLFGLALALFTVAQYRVISVRGEALRIRTLFGVTTLPAAEVALGISVTRSSRGGPTYTVYARAGSQRASLSDTYSQASAGRQRERLTSALIGSERQPSQARDDNALRVADAEAAWKRADAEALAAVASYRGSGVGRKATVAAVLLFALLTVGTLAFALLR